MYLSGPTIKHPITKQHKCALTVTLNPWKQKTSMKNAILSKKLMTSTSGQKHKAYIQQWVDQVQFKEEVIFRFQKLRPCSPTPSNA
jgi:hypothetical protein